MVASTTVGIPIAITGIFNVSLLISMRLFPIPLPGEIPAVVIWMVLFNLSIEEDAKASITINKSGFVFSTIPSIKSFVSIPVDPVTLGLKLATFLYPSSTSPNKNKCLVTNT